MYTAFECITGGFVNGLASKYYHYTTLQACYQIIENNDLWMSDIRYLNDTKEILSCKQKVMQKIGNIKVQQYPELFDYYAASFSRTSNSLSQWQTYADKNRGVCIEFDLTKDGIFRSLFKGGRVIPQQVIYNPNNTQKIIDHCYQIAEIIHRNAKNINHIPMADIANLTSKILAGGFVSLISSCVLGCVAKIAPTLSEQSCQDNEVIEKTAKYLDSTETARTLVDIYIQLSQLLYPFVKEESFAHEEEMRIVAFKRKESSMTVRHRCSNGIIIPYIRIQDLIPKDIECHRNLPITKIIVGSSAPDRRTIQSIKDFLAHKNMSHIKVVKSHIPYINQSK